MANSNIGRNRLVVGAHYGLKDWMAQRVTAVIMGAYTLILLLAFFTGHNFSYVGWSGLFAHQWMKVATAVTIIALTYHAWVGMRDIWMDYVKPTGVRLGLQLLTIVWLLGCAVYAVQVLWRV